MGHIYTNNDMIYQFIYSFHMPLFFVLSGVFFRNQYTVKELIRKRIPTLIIPYLFFYILTFLYWVLIERYLRTNSGGVEAEWWKPILGLFYESPYWNFFAHNNPLWFVPALISTEILACSFSKYNFKFRCLIGIICIGLSFIFSYFNLLLPFGLIMACYCFLFHCISSKVHLLYKLTSKSKSYIFIILLIIYCIYICYYGYVPSTIFYPQPDTAIIFYFIAIYTILLLLLFALLFQKIYANNIIGKIISFFGSNTLLILCIHDPLKRIIIFLYSKITTCTINDVRHDILNSLICLVIICIILIPIIILYNKVIKPFLNKISFYVINHY